MTGPYDPNELADRMKRMGYEVAARGIGGFIHGFDGVVNFSVPSYCSHSAIRRVLREINLKAPR